MPVASLSYSYYGDTEVSNSSNQSFEYNMSHFSQMALMPIYVGKNDMIMVGDYASWSTFEIQNGPIDNFEVTSLALPIGWLRQIDPAWQVMAFTAPFGHNSNLDGAELSGQLMSGVFARYVKNEKTWWAFGFYSDLNPVESYAIPYLGVFWTLNEEWSLNLIFPWPSLSYAPNEDWLFSLGLAPSGGSWAIEAEDEEIYYNMDAWDFSLNAERRIHEHIWLSIRAGVGGLRSLRITSSGVEDSDFGIDSGWYFGLKLNIRP
ncbi:MAG: DUF6268 family outer membrane beta-barrel protein [Verrucomicrobiota bacterium]